jgi:hypothetical protein
MVQVSWGSPMQGSESFSFESFSLSSSPRMSSSLCSHPLTLATQDEEACALDADPVCSCAATLSSIEPLSGTASKGMQVACCQQEQQQQQQPTEVPMPRSLKDSSWVSVGADEYVGHAPHSSLSHSQRPRQNQAFCVQSSDTDLLPTPSAQLLKRFAQSPSSDVPALSSASADGYIECVRKLVAAGVLHTPSAPPPNPSQTEVPFSDIDSAALPLMLASKGATTDHVECAQGLLSAGALANWSMPIDGRAALFDAAEISGPTTMDMLLSEGADPSRFCVFSSTPLPAACRAFGALHEANAHCPGETRPNGNLVDTPRLFKSSTLQAQT